MVLIFNFRGCSGKKIPKWLKTVLWLKPRKSTNILKYEYFVRKNFQDNSSEKSATNSLDTIIDLVTRNFQALEKIDAENNLNKIIIEEWKELAVRIDSTFFLIFFLINIAMSTMLINKFFLNAKIDNKLCGCP